MLEDAAKIWRVVLACMVDLRKGIDGLATKSSEIDIIKTL